MRLVTRPRLIGLALFLVWLAYVAYTFSGAYRARFEAKFNKVQAGDSYDRVVSLLGKPDYYCPIDQYSFAEGQINPVRATVAVTEIYRIGTWDYGVEFPYVGNNDHGAVARTVVSADKTICPGRDNKH